MENKKLKILVIDDNSDNLISLKALIKESFAQASIFTAQNGKTGIDLTVAQDPDVILLDIVMPEIDGFEVCEKLKSDMRTADIPVVFVTALKSDRETRLRALECGAEAFLAKPIDEMELVAQIRAMVKIKTAAIEKKDENNRLAMLVEERTKELRKMEAIVQRTDKLDSIGILAGGIAHDFNNLLGGIFGYVDMANNISKEAKVSEFLEKSLSTIDRARGLTQQLLTFAKGGAPVKKAGKLFPFLRETTQFVLSGSNVICRFDYPDDLWTCNFDKNHIGQVVDNLIINAQQAMPIGGEIEFSSRNISVPDNKHPVLLQGDYVKISIKDSGIGMPKDLLPKIFDPFFTTKSKGQGLGLATCHSIISRHGGSIDVESTPGTGTVFHIYLPASRENISPIEEAESIKYKGKGTFLVMDDEQVILDIISAMLSFLGHTVVCKSNGLEAINFFKDELKAGRKIAGMIFDLTVPGGMGGKEAIKEIRKMCPKTPGFVASGYADDPVISNPTEYGFTASISKPFRINDLIKMLKTHMSV